MSRVLKDELQGLRKNLMTCFRETLPSKQFNALLSLSIIWLGVLVDREEKIEDEEEREEVMSEFERVESKIKKGIQMLYEQTKNKPNGESLKTDSYFIKEFCTDCGVEKRPEGRCFTCPICGQSDCG